VNFPWPIANWLGLPSAARIFEYGRGRARLDGKEHPTQKPISVMEWCLGHLPPSVASVCDPFMGAGTTGVACARRRLAFAGIEREPRYFDIACRRIEEAQRQGDLLRDVLPKAEQTKMAL
jgi:site-specific DNA-methyltransferase (adenine-specific)